MTSPNAPMLALAGVVLIGLVALAGYLWHKHRHRHPPGHALPPWFRRLRPRWQLPSLRAWRSKATPDPPPAPPSPVPPSPVPPSPVPARVAPPVEPPARFTAAPAPALSDVPEPSVRRLLLAAPPHAVPEPVLPDWVVARCTLQSSYFQGGRGGGDVARLTVRGAALRGVDHALTGQEGQDVTGVVWDERSGALYAAVADGLGSLPDSGRVASDAVRHALDRCRNRSPGEAFDDFSRTVFKEICLSIDGSEPPRNGATTLIVAEVVPEPGGAVISVCGVGDSEAWVLRGGRWHALHHERRPGVDNATRHLPGHPDPKTRSVRGIAGDVLVLGTDGFAGALAAQSALGDELMRRWRTAPAALEFLAHVDFYDGYRADDRAVVSIWIG